MQICFWILLFQFSLFIFSKKTEIKFSLNVPSLFRCKKNGPVFYFEKFPTYDLFYQTIIDTKKDCDLILLPSDKRVIFDIKEHVLQCTYRWLKGEDRLNEIIVFKSNCTLNDKNDLCIRLTPTNAIIVTDYLRETNEPMTIDLSIHGIGTENIQIGDDEQYPYSVRKPIKISNILLIVISENQGWFYETRSETISSCF